MDCIICGNWFSSVIHNGACPTCERAIKQLGLKMMPNRIKELVQAEKNGRLVVLPPNNPLTLEQLREMDGEPVWVERHSNFDCIPHWALVHVHRRGNVYLTERNCGQILFRIGDKVYRRKPEGGLVWQQ